MLCNWLTAGVEGSPRITDQRRKDSGYQLQSKSNTEMYRHLSKKILEKNFPWMTTARRSQAGRWSYIIDFLPFIALILVDPLLVIL